MKTARRALITGGGSGIGLAIAKAFAEDGLTVIVAGRDAAKLRATGLLHVTMDAADEDSVAAALAEIGPVDILVAAAGAAATAPALKTAPADLEAMLRANLMSVYHCSRTFVPPMIERGWGRFIAIASTASLKGYAYAGAYVAAKHAVLGWIRTLALEIATTGVTANAICPGYTDTPLIDAALAAVGAKTGKTAEEARAVFARSNPMRRLVLPREVAEAARFLVADAAGAANGLALAVDGGETAA